MVNITINGQKIKVKEETTILDAAKSAGITIPKPVSYTHLIIILTFSGKKIMSL